MIARDLVALRAYDKTIELYSNAYSFWYDRIEYYNDADKEKIYTAPVEDGRVVIDDLTEGYYTFYGVNESGEKSRALELYFEKKDSLAAFLSSLDDDAKLIFSKYMDKIDSSSFELSLYRVLCEAEDEYEYSILKEVLYKAIDQYNNEQLLLNRQTDAFRIYISHSHLLVAVGNNDTEFISDMYLKLENVGIGSLNELIVKITEPTFSKRLPDGLYRLGFYQKDRLIYEYYFYANSADGYERYESILASLEEKKARNLSSISNLPSDWVYSSLEEEKVLVNLCGFNDESALFARPHLQYLDGLIEITLKEDILDYLKTVTMHRYYLCAVKEEDIYNKKITPIRIEITGDGLIFNPWKYMFKEAPYYFYLADENNIRISEVSYLDLSIEQKADEDIKDYNNSFQRASWGRFTKNLYDIVAEEKPELWPTIKNTIDAALLAEEIGYTKPIDSILDKVLEIWNERYGNICWVILYLYLCEHKYYMRKDRRFMKHQHRSDYYKTHVIPAGDYILSVIRINKDKIDRKFFYDPSNAQSIRFDKDEYIIFYCINPDDYSVSDFGFYNNTTYGTSFRYNSLEVEKVE